MSDSVGKKAKRSVQDLARDSFEKIKEEPGEIARSASEQMTGIESSSEKLSEERQVAEEKRKEEKDKEKSRRLMSAHKKELEDIRRESVFSEVLTKIREGEDVNISSIEGLTETQKQILLAQKEAVKTAQENQKEAARDSRLAEPSTKQKRGLIQKAKTKVEQMKTRIETKFKSVG